MKTEVIQQFPPLESVTKPNLTTRELAHYSNTKEILQNLPFCLLHVS